MIQRWLGTLLKNLILRIGVVASLTLLLLWTILLATSASLAGAIRGLEIAELLLPLTLALGLGWWTGAVRRPVWLAIALCVFGGSLFLIVHFGGLYNPIFRLLRTIFITLADEWPWRVDWAPAYQGITELSRQTGSFISRLSFWMVSLWQRQPRFDPSAVQAFWGWLLWLGAAWAGWWTRRHQAVLIAVLPLVALLAGTLNYVGESSAGLLIPGGVTLLLLGVLAVAQNESDWDTHGIDFSTELRLDLTISILLSVISLVALAWITPPISVQKILTDTWSWIPRPGERSEQVAESLGIQPNAPQGGEIGIRGGLPRSHLIGSGPDLEQHIVLVIATGDLPPMTAPEAARQPIPRYYWRLLTYDTYTGTGWENGPTRQAMIAPGDTIASPPEPPTRHIRQDISSLVELPYLVSAGEPTNASIPVQAEWRIRPETDEIQDFAGASIAAEQYQVEAYLPPSQAAARSGAEAESPEWIQATYLQLPASLPVRVRRLAFQLTAGTDTIYEAAQEIETYLRAYPYSLDLPPPPAEGDIVDHFLFSLERGYCDYFASAMVVLARAAGIPARLAIGYASGYYDAPRARYLVRAAEAHSWPELYFPQTGWVIYEPTSGEANLDEKALLPPFLITDHGSLPGVDDRLEDRQQSPAALSWLASYWPLLAGLLLVFGTAILFQLPVWRLRRLGPTAALHRIYTDMRKVSSWLAIPHQPGDTPNEFAASVQAYLTDAFPSGWQSALFIPGVMELQSIVSLYNREFFSRKQLSNGEQRHAVEAWSRLRWRLRLAKFAWQTDRQQ